MCSGLWQEQLTIYKKIKLKTSTEQPPGLTSQTDLQYEPDFWSTQNVTLKPGKAVLTVDWSSQLIARTLATFYIW